MRGLFRQVEHISFPASADGGRCRAVTFAIPKSNEQASLMTIYCADGQLVELFKNQLETCATDIPLPALIGLHSEDDVRAQEYLLNYGATFKSHETFLTSDLRKWVCKEIGLSPERSRNAVFGFSNGGALAVTTALRYPELFCAAIAFSVPPLGTLPSLRISQEHSPAFYLASGNLGPERFIRKNILKLARTLRQHRLDVEYSQRPAGHEVEFWVSEFPIAIDWLQKKQEDRFAGALEL